MFKKYKHLLDWSKYNFEIIAYVNNYLDAKEKLQEYVPDLIITDINLKNGTSFDILDLIKKNKAKTKVIVCSGDIQ